MNGRQPRSLIALAALGAVFVAIPLVALVVRTPWSRIATVLGEPLVIEALRLSIVTSIIATALAALLGIPLAWALARLEFRGRSLLRGLVLLPLVLPPVVGGAAMLFAFGRRGVVGEVLESATGLVLPFSTAGAVLAVTFVAMPFVVITVEGGLRNLDTRYEDAAASLGASRWTVLRRVTLPLMFPTLLAGMVLTWARALGEFGATITFAGNLAGRTQTLPLAVFVALETDQDAAIAISLMMMLVSLGVLVGLRDRWWGAWR